MNQWLAVWERYCVVAECCGMQTRTQLLHYKASICQLLELTRKLGLNPQRVILYDDMFRFHLSARAASGDPTIDMDKYMQTIDKEVLAQVDMRLADVMKKMGVDERVAAELAAAGPFPVLSQHDSEVLRRLRNQHEEFHNSQKEMLHAIRNGKVIYDDNRKGKRKGKGKSGDTFPPPPPPGGGKGNGKSGGWPKRGRAWVDYVKDHKKTRR